MRDAWIFTHSDQWERAEVIDDLRDGEDIDVWMARLGYRPHSRARNSDIVEFVGSWMLYTAQAPSAPHAHALLVNGALEWGVLVWLPTFPDLLAYMAKYAEIGQQEWQEMEWEGMRDTIKKFFRAWHGHEATSFCQECDPHQYEIWRQKQSERHAKKA